MDGKRRLARAGGTVACALGIGFFMQQGDESRGEPQSLAPAPIERAVLDPSVQKPEIPLDLQDIKLTSALPESPLPGLIPAAARNRPAPRDTDQVLRAPADPDTPSLGCDVVARAKPTEMASVLLSVNAPCYGNERITVHHSGMMFTETTSTSGKLSVTVPVLSENAVFIVEFENGKGAVALARVPSLADYDRVALQWSGNNGFQMHAREFGASYGEQGHIWSGKETVAANGGHVTRLGDDQAMAPQLAEIYSFPTQAAHRAGTVDLTVEAEVTQGNCGREVAAQSLELRGKSALRTRDLTLAMPNCAAVGDFLVLNNLVDDLKIAAR